MSKLPNAPLLEVVFELTWDNRNKNELKDFQYLHGDLYSKLKHKYPNRISLVPPEVPYEVLIKKVVHQFRKSKNGYPLFQVGPGILTLNTIDDEYYWEIFYNNASELLNTFIDVNPFDENKNYHPNLNYYDFFPFDFENHNVYDYLNEKFNITFKQNFLNVEVNPNGLNIGFYYKTSLGNINVNFRRGKAHNRDGIVLQTKLLGQAYKLNKEALLYWLSEAHKFCSETFKNLTEGELYESFK